MRNALLTATLLVLATAAAGSDELEQALALLDRLDQATISEPSDDAELEDVLVWLSEESDIVIRADWEALRRLGVKKRTPVAIDPRGAAVSTALSALMLQLGDEYSRPVYEIHAGQVVITTVEGTAPMRLTDVYDVRDLLARRDLVEALVEGRPSLDTQADPEGGAAPEEDAQAGGDRAPPPSPPSSTSPSGASLLFLILDHVDPDAWIDFGGTRGKITERDGVLMVTVAPTTHRRVRDALARLRQATPGGITLELALADVPVEALSRLSRDGQYDRAGVARAMLRHDRTRVLWRTLAVSELNRQVTVDTADGTSAVVVEVKPTFDKERGRLSLKVKASIETGADRRQVETTVTVPRRHGAVVIELPPAQAETDPSHRRFLLLIPRPI